MTETTGERLRRLRGKRTIQEVSEATGVAASTISSLENDKRGISDEGKMRLASYYGRTVAYIFFNNVNRKT